MLDPKDPGPDYTLAWPRELFSREASLLLRTANTWSVSRAELLLEEAFVGDAPRDDLRAVSWDDLPTGSAFWNPEDVRSAFVRELLSADRQLPLEQDRRPYYAVRHHQPSGEPVEQSADRPLRARREWAALVNRMLDIGYFDRAAPRSCVDGTRPPQHEVLDGLTGDLLGLTGLWPLSPGAWTDNTFYSLIEVVHDLVARPRDRVWHDHADCGWHYSEFAVSPGQMLYRWRANRLLARFDAGLEIASDGADTGRLVHTDAHDRHELVRRSLTHPSVARDDVAHAVALWRSRTATNHDKRSAIFTLGRILEDRKSLLQRNLFSKDETALFEVANRYDLRHRNASQRSDYDPIFLDWVFWWYLATVELTDRLIAREAEQ